TTPVSRPTAPPSPGPPPATGRPRRTSPPWRAAPPDASPTGGAGAPRCAAGPPTGRSSRSAPRARPACAAAGPGPSRWTAARPPPCRTGRSATSPTARTPCCCRPRWAVRRPGGSGTGAAPRASCGSTARARASSSGCTRSWTATSNIRCGWETGSRSSPTTRAPAPCTPPSPTAPTCAGTPPSAASTPATPPPTAPASSTPARANCGCWTTSTAPSRAAWTSASAGRAWTSSRIRSTPPAGFGSAAPDHTARGNAVAVRGAVHWVTHRAGPARALAAEPGVRARLPRTFRADGEQWVVWVTDAEGDDALEFAPATGVAPGATPRRLAAGRLGRVLELAMAPDGSRAAVASHDGRLLLVERESGEVREVDRSDNGDVSGLVFSPDSGWLAWSHPGPRPLSQLRLANTTDLSVTEATPLRFQDYAPAFTLDGKHLAFLSHRSFDPVYDEHVFDLAFVESSRPYLITLAATTPSPFGPQRHGRAFEVSDKEETPDSEGAPATRIDLDGLADRIVPFPVEAARYSGLRAARDGVLWLRHPVTGVLGAARATPDDPDPKTELERYDLAQQRLEHLAADADHFEVSGDGKRVLAVDRRQAEGWSPSDRRASNDEDSDSNITRRPRPRPADGRPGRRVAADVRGDRPHHAGPLLAARHGRRLLGRRPRPLPARPRPPGHPRRPDGPAVGGARRTRHLARLRHPHGGFGNGPRQGLLGADLSRHEDGNWRVDRVLPSETSDPDARSPLAAPGVAVRAGDAILAVGGRPVDPVAGPAPLLVGTAGKPVELTVSPAGGGEVRHAVVVPLADEEPLRYHAWVADRRAYVHERSGGRLGYLHVPDMQAPGWAQIHRDLRVEVAREGLVVDVRENRGGHTSQLVVEKLARRIVGWDLPRGMRPHSYPQDAPRGPVVAVANEFSGSDGDIVNAAIKALGIGPVVGTRTWGGVIGIDSRYRLVDGTLITQPKYAFWLEGQGWGVENHGVDPDVEVLQRPQDHAAGRDPQLDEAIRLALEALETTPAKTPPELPPLRS
ncbi:LOW QUALITY PROTEIN: tricorn protease, partial [Streptomyces sp. e14]